MDTSKLPKWARERIEVAEREAAYWKRQAGTTEDDDSQTFWHLAGTRVGVPDAATVTYRVPGGFTTRFDVMRDTKDPALLRVHGSGIVRILPRAANAFDIRLDGEGGRL